MARKSTAEKMKQRPVKTDSLELKDNWYYVEFLPQKVNICASMETTVNGVTIDQYITEKADYLQEPLAIKGTVLLSEFPREETLIPTLYYKNRPFYGKCYIAILEESLNKDGEKVINYRQLTLANVLTCLDSIRFARNAMPSVEFKLD